LASLSYRNAVKRILSGTWTWRKPVFSGKLLRSQGSERHVHLWHRICLQKNNKKKNSCGSVVGRFHCTTDQNLVPETGPPDWTFSLLPLGAVGQCWVSSFKYRTRTFRSFTTPRFHCLCF